MRPPPPPCPRELAAVAVAPDCCPSTRARTSRSVCAPHLSAERHHGHVAIRSGPVDLLHQSEHVANDELGRRDDQLVRHFVNAQRELALVCRLLGAQLAAQVDHAALFASAAAPLLALIQGLVVLAQQIAKNLFHHVGHLSGLRVLDLHELGPPGRLRVLRLRLVVELDQFLDRAKLLRGGVLHEDGVGIEIGDELERLAARQPLLRSNRRARRRTAEAAPLAKATLPAESASDVAAKVPSENAGRRGACRRHAKDLFQVHSHGRGIGMPQAEQAEVLFGGSQFLQQPLDAVERFGVGRRDDHLAIGPLGHTHGRALAFSVRALAGIFSRGEFLVVGRRFALRLLRWPASVRVILIGVAPQRFAVGCRWRLRRRIHREHDLRRRGPIEAERRFTSSRRSASGVVSSSGSAEPCPAVGAASVRWPPTRSGTSLSRGER